MMRTLTLPVILASLLAVTACAPTTELQQDQSGSDKMLPSPCACQQLDYKAPTYKWRTTT
jgi:hypothetical protein